MILCAIFNFGMVLFWIIFLTFSYEELNNYIIIFDIILGILNFLCGLLMIDLIVKRRSKI
jgi:hypothetical protein